MIGENEALGHYLERQVPGFADSPELASLPESERDRPDSVAAALGRYLLRLEKRAVRGEAEAAELTALERAFEVLEELAVSDDPAVREALVVSVFDPLHADDVVVPNFQPGHRHRASVGFPSAGGKGINVARALKRLGTPVVCTGLAGGRTGTLLVEELTNEGILNDFVRIRHDSRTSIAVLDPTSNAYTEIYEWGPEVGEEELEILVEKLAYLAQRAEFVVLAGSLPRGIDTSLYGDLVRELSRAQLLAVVDAEGEPLSQAVEAEPYLVSPNQQEAEALVGHEFVDDEDLAAGLDEIAELGARNVIITLPTGCYALLREDRTELRVRAVAPQMEAVSTVGAGDTLLAGFLAARVAGKPFEDAVRAAVAAGAASVLEAGPGRFDPREANRLTSLVQLERIEHVPR